MRERITADCHTHTSNSFDADCPIDIMCASAIKKGVEIIAFTDHIEMDCFEKDGFDKTADESFDDIVRAKEKYKNQLKVLVGIELGEATYAVEKSEKLLGTKDYDIVVASIHNLRNVPDFYFLDYTEKSADEYLKTYFNELKILAKWGKFDTLAHMTYPLRYIVGEHNVAVDLKKYEKDIDEVLTLLVKSGKALEINTSGLRQRINTTLPDEKIVRRFKELGGKYITVGSDSHCAEDVGSGINDGISLAKHCGFDCITVYEKRKAIEIPIR